MVSSKVVLQMSAGARWALGSTRLVLVLAIAAGCGGGADSEGAQAGTRQPDVVLVVIDTLRADRLGVYGGPAENSPALDGLAARSVVFDDAVTSAPWTLPSTASVLTGRHPYRHGADLTGGGSRDLGADTPGRLAGDATTLAKVLKDHGYATKAFVANPYLSLGLEQGFEEFRVENTEGAEISAWARQELLAERDAPVFLYLHYMDTHMPILVPHADVRHITQRRGVEEMPAVEYRAITPLVPLPGVRESALVYYDAAVHYVDRCIQTVLDAVDESGAGDSTIFCVVTDHGEEFFDHQGLQSRPGEEDPRGTPGLGHGHTLFRELIWPVWILGGSALPPGRVSQLVSLMDVAPTLLELVGIDPAPLGMDGASAVGLVQGRAADERALLVGSIAYGRDREAVVTRQWKLIVDVTSDEPLHLFDRESDPLERQDVLEDHPEAVARLMDLLAERRAALPRREASGATLSDELRRELEAIGY